MTRLITELDKLGLLTQSASILHVLHHHISRSIISRLSARTAATISLEHNFGIKLRQGITLSDFFIRKIFYSNYQKIRWCLFVRLTICDSITQKLQKCFRLNLAQKWPIYVPESTGLYPFRYLFPFQDGHTPHFCKYVHFI